MEKWADYAITKVRYDAAETHIEKVTIQADDGERLGPKEEKTRQQVIDLLDEKKTIITAPPSKVDGTKVVEGPTVQTVLVADKHYIRSDASKTARDHLENLPRC